MKQFPIKNFLLVCGSSGKTNVKCNNENLMKRLLGTHTNSWEILQLKKDVNIAKQFLHAHNCRLSQPFSVCPLHLEYLFAPPFLNNVSFCFLEICQITSCLTQVLADFKQSFSLLSILFFNFTSFSMFHVPMNINLLTCGKYFSTLIASK